MVMGVSAGVGKSTFSKQLGEILNLNVHHLDTLYWKPGWVEASLEEFSQKQNEIVKEDEWIIEGNYSNTYDIRMKRADTIIYLELPLRVCLYRVITRFLKNLGKNRSDMGEGCTEKLDYPFLKFIITTYKSRKKKMRDRFQVFLKNGKDKKVYELKSKKEIREFLHNLAHDIQKG